MQTCLSGRNARLLGLGSSLLAFFIYLLGSSPALDGGDAGEFIAASSTLGVSHAPGYPLIALLLKAAQFVIPFGSIAYRCHVFSVLLAVVVLLLLVRLLRDLSVPLSASIGVALLVATRPLFVEQARVVEVFMLNAVFLLAILIALRRNQVPLAAFLLGIGLGNHHTLLVVAPVFLWSVWYFRVDRQQLILTVLAFLIGFSVYAYLPIRAHANPPVNFGDPETWQRFWAVITRKEFGSLSLHPAALPFRDSSTLSAQFHAFLARNWHQLGWGGFVMCMGGFALAMSRSPMRLWALGLGVTWLAVGFGFEALANLSPFSDIGQWRLERFLLLPLLMVTGMAVWIWTVAGFLTQRLFRFAAISVLVLMMLPSAWSAFVTSNFRWNLAYRDFAVSTLRSAPRDTRLVIDRVLFDEPTSALLVATQVEGLRPDVRFYYRPGSLFEPVYGTDLLTLSWDARYQRQAEVERDLVATSGPLRCLAFDKKTAPFPNPVLGGLLYQPANIPNPGSPPQRGGGRDGVVSDVFNEPFLLVSRGSPSPTPSPFGEGKSWWAPDYPSRLIHAHTPYFLGKAALEAGDTQQSIRWFESALSVGPDMAWLHSNIGGLYAQRGELAEARRMFEKTVKLDPYFYEGLFGVAFVALKTGRYGDAESALERAVRVGPDRSDGWYMLGVARYEMKDNAGARGAWKTYLELDPHGAMAEVVGKKLQEQ